MEQGYHIMLHILDTARFGLTLEHGRKKVEEINISCNINEDIRVPRSCHACTSPTCAEGKCPVTLQRIAAFKKKKAVEELTLRILLAINLGCTVYSILLSDEQ